MALALKYADPASEFLAEAYSVLGQIENAQEHRAPAELALKNALRIRQALDPKGAKTAQSLQILGGHFAEFQDHAAAITAMQQALTILKNLAGTNNDANFSIVVFPDPIRPKRATLSPGLTLKEIF